MRHVTSLLAVTGLALIPLPSFAQPEDRMAPIGNVEATIYRDTNFRGPAAAILLTFVNTFYETEGAWLIGAPAIRTMPVMMIFVINNQPVIQLGAVLSMILWIPSLVALLFARRVIASGAFARGFGA